LGIFASLHTRLSDTRSSIRRALRVVKHPVEPFLKTKGPEDRIPLAKVREILSQPHGNPGPEFVEDNQARRVEAHTKRMEAEARLADALIERERARERRKRAQDD
jgi:hypothetical protein